MASATSQRLDEGRQTSSTSGVLYVIATPIGNLGDVSTRLRDQLESVDLIAAEDTRRTGRLLNALGVRGRFQSYHAHNEARVAPRLVEQLESGASVALVSDAGTPGISDPGYRLVRSAIEHEIRVESIPGPSAILAALVVSGLPTDRFVFEGFLPRRAGLRDRRLRSLAGLPHTLVLFESPGRLRKLLEAVAGTLGDRPVAVCRELTKLHEETWRGTVRGWLAEQAARRLRGEVTVVIGGESGRRHVDPE